MELSMYEETHSQFSAKGAQDLRQFDEPTVIITALFCFIVFVIFLIMFSDKIFIETTSSIQLPVPELSMVIAKLPFQVDFQHLDKATIAGGIDVKITTTEPVEMSCYWGASCQLFIHALNSDPFYLLDEVEHLDEVESTSKTVCRGDGQSFHLVPEASEEEFNIGPPPRSKYPLVIILRCSGDNDSDNENTIVGGIWILHLPDSSFNTPGHIISNLVITNHGLVHNLQKMYMAVDTVNTVNSNPSPNIAEVSSSRQAQNTSGDGLTQTSNTCENGTSQSSQNMNGYATRQSYVASGTTAGQSCNRKGTCQSQGVTRTNTSHNESSSENSSASTPNSSAEMLGEDSFGTLYDGQHDCTVCQNSPISRVILPCRHVCICEECLHLVSKCPMCRGPVTSHFSLYPNTPEHHRDIEAGDNSWLGYLQQLNDRLNRSLGFT